MRASDLIKKLEQYQESHGDLEVQLGVADQWAPAAEVEYDDNTILVHDGE